MISSCGYLSYLILLSLSSSINSFVIRPSTSTNDLIPTIHRDPKTTTVVPRYAHDSAHDSAHDTPPPATTRSTFLQKSLLAATSSLLCLSAPPLASASTSAAAALEPKQTGLSPEKIAAIVESDMVDRSFLTTGDLTRSIYAESATFRDEIDTYKLEAWMKGTAKLFVGPPSSNTNLVGGVESSATEVSFRFEEDLMFRIPLRPVVHLTGRVVLEREEGTGLIKSYREFWDQDVGTVLKSAKFSFGS